MSTICAVSTPNAVGGIAVVRISGDNAIDVATRVFKPFGEKSVEKMEGYTCAYGSVVADGEVIDDAVLTVFRCPASFTGEDTAEISCHGGIFVTRKVLRACLDNGAVLAEAGEFTKRAFLNGKISLTQAEAVMEVISAQGEQALRSANLTREGRLFAKIKGVSDRLVAVLGELGAWVDYPEEDLPEVENSALLATVNSARATLSEILASYDTGRILREGVDTAIVGKPNVGKSTLMNMLLGFERSIVTDIAGTTRDCVEESVRLGDVVLRLSDTAGIRDTGDVVEGFGVAIARKRLETCDLIIAVFDNSTTLSAEDREVLDFIEKSGKKAIIILNKSDLEQIIDRDELARFGEVIEISAKNFDGSERITEAISKLFELDSYNSSAQIFANERQKICCERALTGLETATSALEIGESLDAVTVTIDEAVNALLELTGEKATEAVVNEVFSHFCVGK